MTHEPPPAAAERVRIDVPLAEPDDRAVREELRAALLSTPREIPAKYFYDDRGSELFERITELPEYYPTRAEAALLARVADRVVARTRACELVELGAGAATKTRILLDAMAREDCLERYVPVDVSDGIMRRVAEELVVEYPRLEVHGVVADFMTDLHSLPPGERRLIAFLGGTIGNLDPNSDAVDFLRHLREVMTADHGRGGDHLLLGTDLVKDPAVIEAAYNDTQGVTAAFNKNALAVVNATFGADFAPERFRHRAFFDRSRRWIEMRLVSEVAQRVRIEALDLELELEAGEEIRTEISAKFDRPRVTTLLEKSGFRLVEWLPGEDGLFALSLAAPAAQS